jgi:hypothetical protein
MKQYEVWMEGYAATGNSSGAEFCGLYEAESFAEACAAWNKANKARLAKEKKDKDAAFSKEFEAYQQFWKRFEE